VFSDESGYLLQPTARRTWAPAGQTPIHYSWDRRDRLSAVAALSLSPVRRRLGLCFDLVDHNITADDFEVFVRQVQRRLRRPLALVLDRYAVHRCAVRRLQAAWGRRLAVHWLPAYAPDLNPVEQVWKRSKCDDLANFIPPDLLALGHAVSASIRHTATQQSLLRSFFHHAGLKL